MRGPMPPTMAVAAAAWVLLASAVTCHVARAAAPPGDKADADDTTQLRWASLAPILNDYACVALRVVVSLHRHTRTHARTHARAVTLAPAPAEVAWCRRHVCLFDGPRQPGVVARGTAHPNRTVHTAPA